MVRNSVNIGGIAYNKIGFNDDSSDNLMILLDLIDDFNRLTDYEELLAKVGEASKSIMKAEASSVLLLDEERNELSVAYSTGPVKHEVKGKRIARNHGYCGWVATHKMPLIANNINNNDEIFGGELSENFTTRNLICAPLLDDNNNVVGVIEAINRNDRNKLEEKDLSIFQALANHAATAIKRSQAEKEKASRMQEQDMYLTEIHHRVKNDLALISGIVELESLDIENEEARKVLRNIQSRIKSMAIVYELLSDQGTHNKAELGAYIKKLAEGISASLKNRNTDISIEVDTEEIIIDPYRALSCGLILNELILNTYKHAFSDKDTGLITIDLAQNNGHVIVSYSDTGKGLPDDFKIEEQDSLGFKMIEALVKQLDGALELYNNGGAHFGIIFRVGDHKERKPIPY